MGHKRVLRSSSLVTAYRAGQRTPPQIGQLLLDFFGFVAELVDDGHGHEKRSTLPSRRVDVVSVKHARLLSREEAWGSFAWLTTKNGKLKTNINRLSIQDPFNLAHDVGSPMRRDREFIAELRRAERLLVPAADEPQLQRVFVEMVCDSTDLAVVQVDADGWHVPRKPVSSRRAVTGGDGAQSDRVFTPAAQKRSAAKRNARKRETRKQRAFLEEQTQRERERERAKAPGSAVTAAAQAAAGLAQSS